MWAWAYGSHGSLHLNEPLNEQFEEVCFPWPWSFFDWQTLQHQVLNAISGCYSILFSPQPNFAEIYLWHLLFQEDSCWDSVYLAYAISCLKINYNSALSIGGFNQYPPPALENACRLINSQAEDNQNIGLLWVRKLLYLQVTVNGLTGV